MKALLISITIPIILFTSISCEKERPIIYSIPDGLYIGVFQRNGYDTSMVTMVFKDNQWSGSGTKNKYPALCQGTYKISSNLITFSNTCAWTTEFDSSLILSGSFHMNVKGNVIEFFRISPYLDRYVLEKQ
jgi:hypothetical protein